MSDERDLQKKGKEKVTEEKESTDVREEQEAKEQCMSRAQ